MYFLFLALSFSAAFVTVVIYEINVYVSGIFAGFTVIFAIITLAV